MGLDITHYKATLQRPKLIDPFNRHFITVKDFEGFDTSIEYFDKNLQLVDDPIILKTIIFPKRENEIQEVKEFLKYDEYEFLFEKDLNEINNTINLYQERNFLTKTLLHKWEAPKWFGFHFYEYEKVDGFYFEEVGYQRKGMNENFWTRFASENINSFTKKEDFDFALTCVDYYWDDDQKEEVENRKQIFKENFVDKYETNKSWISVCG